MLMRTPRRGRLPRETGSWAERHWLVPAAPQTLAALRVLGSGYMLAHIWRRRRMLQQVARSDRALFAPVGTARVLSEPLSPQAFRGLLDTTQALNLAVLLGVRHRLTGPLYGASLLSLLSYRNSFSMIYHSDPIPVLHAIILGVSPAADALSVDAALTRPARRRSEAHWRYGWPIRLMNAVTVLTYLLAGVAKVKGPLGWRWAGGEALRSQIAVDGLRKELMGEGASPLAFRLYDDRVALLALRALAAGSLVVELGAPGALVSPRAGRFWALNAFGMHWGIFAVMRIKFRYQLSGIAFAAFAAFAAERRR